MANTEFLRKESSNSLEKDLFPTRWLKSYSFNEAYILNERDVGQKASSYYCFKLSVKTPGVDAPLRFTQAQPCCSLSYYYISFLVTKRELGVLIKSSNPKGFKWMIIQ
ncbi:unnamed protein product [Sphenostylis stenocarpa]|uniref:Uncharacterized protein n=1 Tax=Sphenostylis stenocarpa TaxID=92480 RepID=A0AA86V812_9FABA|nr:unnamed protein product [Sphenostylis stenocarpa]